MSNTIDSVASGKSIRLPRFSGNAMRIPFPHQSTPCKRVCLSCGNRLWLRWPWMMMMLPLLLGCLFAGFADCIKTIKKAIQFFLNGLGWDVLSGLVSAGLMQD
jgi:hypothetical protein